MQLSSVVPNPGSSDTSRLHHAAEVRPQRDQSRCVFYGGRGCGMEQPVGPAAPPQLLPFPRRALKLLPTRGLSVAAFRAQRSPGRVSYSFWASASPRVNVAALQPARLRVRLGSGAFPPGLGGLAVRLPPRRPGWASVAVVEPEAAGSRGAWSSPRARRRWPASLLPEALVLLGEEAKGGVVAPERCGPSAEALTVFIPPSIPEVHRWGSRCHVCPGPQDRPPGPGKSFSWWGVSYLGREVLLCLSFGAGAFPSWARPHIR